MDADNIEDTPSGDSGRNKDFSGGSISGIFFGVLKGRFPKQ
jgi:hypothetical protein